MSLTRLTTDQYEDKSVTSAKLADSIEIKNLSVGSTVNINSSATDPFSIYNPIGDREYKMFFGDGIVTTDSTLGTGGGAFLIKQAQSDNWTGIITDLMHLDQSGNLYIKGNLDIGGNINSVITTVNTMEVADCEIILNSGVTTPYASGGKLTINRGGTNFDPYLEWNETSAAWQLYDGTNTARIIDQTYGDARYVNATGDTINGTLNITGGAGTLSLKAGATLDHVYMQFFADSSAQTTRSAFIGYGSAGTSDIAIVNEMTNGKILLSPNGTGYVNVNGSLAVTGDITATGNQIIFANGSTISNKTDGTLQITGDGITKIFGSSANGGLIIDGGIIGSIVASEGYARAAIGIADGKIGFGPGTATRDTWLYRDASNSLKTDGTFTATQLVSNIATGTAPLTVTSTTKVANLNADQVDGCTVNDSGTDTASLWTASKITTQLTNKSNTGHDLINGHAATLGTATTAGYFLKALTTTTYGWAQPVKGDVGLGNVENTALSTWAGTSNITTLGTIATGTWNATVIADGKIASALTGKTYNGLSLTAATDGFTLAGGTTSRTLTVTGANKTLAGTGTGITLTGAYGLTFTMSAATSLTLPVSGTVTALGNSTTGSGSIVLATSPTLVTPTIGVATATSINKVAITAPTTGATLTIADGKTLTANASITLAGTDAKTLTLNNSITFAASNDTSTLNIGTGGTLGSAAFTNSGAYLPIGGGTLTGTLTMPTGVYTDSYTGGALHMSNSNIDGVNAVYFADASDTSAEGIHFYRTSTTVDSIWASNGNIYFTPNRTIGSTATDYAIWHAGNLAFGTSATNMATGNHTHANLSAGNGITGSDYTGGAIQTWSIVSHAGTSGSIGTLSVAADTVGVSLGTTGITACAGNDSRLSDARTPVTHGDSLHNCYAYARISFAAGQSQAVWTHNKNWSNYIIQITPNSPETHFYYMNKAANTITICLDDPAYEALDVDVVLINANTITTSGFTMS